MAKKFYNLERETKEIVKWYDKKYSIYPDQKSTSRLNSWVKARKNLVGQFFGSQAKLTPSLSLSINQSLFAQNSSILQQPLEWEICGWCRLFSSNSSVVEIISKASNNVFSYEFSIRRSFNTISLQSSSAVSWASTGSSSLSPHNWGFINFGRNSTAQILFFSLNAGTEHTTSQPTPNVGSARFAIGSWDSTGRNFDGNVSNFGYWNRNLSAEERSTVYNSGNGVSYFDILLFHPELLSGLVSYWGLDNPYGIRFDMHGSNHLTPVSPPNLSTGLIESFI